LTFDFETALGFVYWRGVYSFGGHFGSIWKIWEHSLIEKSNGLGFDGMNCPLHLVLYFV
jgi:hypothetical protein